MILTFLNLVLAIVGSLALAVAVFIVIDQPLQRIWSRHWLRQRLGNSFIVQPNIDTPSAQHVARQNPTLDAVINEEMANLLDAVGREMQLGRSLTAALIHTYPAYPALAGHIRPIAQSCERGVSITEVLPTSEATSTSAAMPSSVLFGIRALWAATTGSAGALALERAATTLRERTAIQYERRAQSSQARLSIKILTWLPVAFLGWQIIANPLARWFLLASPIGWTLLVGGLGLNWYGRRWMNRVLLGTI
jgi:Flp pilus assembly protein TadB